jgi:hypothetical protein
MKNIEIIGGGTVSHVRNHLAITAPAYGSTARQLFPLVNELKGNDYWTNLTLTKMGGGGAGNPETNEDVSKLVDQWIANPDTRIIFFNPALVDYDGSICESGAIGYDWYNDIETMSGKYRPRLKSADGKRLMRLNPAPKVIGKIRKERKDIFLVAFKTTCDAGEDEQFLTGLHLLKTNSCNLVLANDTRTRVNMVITPEQARYHVTTDRDVALRGLVEMTLSRAQGHFTHSKVVPGDAVPWDLDRIPHSLKAVVEHCIAKGAYKPFNGSTVGHFAFKVSKDAFITSKRKVDFNNLKETGMVLCHSEGDNEVIAYGAKPSVGGQSQRIVFKDHPDVDCIVHFHCPPKYPAELSVRSQAAHECGSHECGINTSKGLREEIPGVKVVYLDNHGPNIVFNHSVDPKEIISFIDQNFDLSKSTDGVDRSRVEVQ